MEKTIAEQLTELKTGLETFSKAEIKSAIDAIETKITAIETKAEKSEVETLKTELEAIKTAASKNQPVIDAFVSSGNRKTAGQETKSFNDILGETIDRNADKIRNYRPNGGELRFDMLPNEQKSADGKTVEVKDVGDISTAMKIYESKQITELGQQVMVSRAGAPKITIDNKLTPTEKSE